jgi:hypothetical protein
MDNYCTAEMDCVYSERTLISGNTITASRSPNGVPGSYGWCLQIDQPKALMVTGMICTTDGQQSVFVDTYPCSQCAITSSAFNADFGGQGITGPWALFHGATNGEDLGNLIGALTISGITETTFQSEWVELCPSCKLQ